MYVRTCVVSPEDFMLIRGAGDLQTLNQKAKFEQDEGSKAWRRKAAGVVKKRTYEQAAAFSTHYPQLGECLGPARSSSSSKRLRQPSWTEEDGRLFKKALQSNSGWS